MQEYAETAMNELLGWYGYDKMNTGETQALNLSLFSASTSFSPRSKRRHAAAAAAVIAPSSDGSSSCSSEDSIGGGNSAGSSISPARRDGSVSPSNHGKYRTYIVYVCRMYNVHTYTSIADTFPYLLM